MILTPAVFILFMGVPEVGRLNTDLFLWVNNFYWYPLDNLMAYVELPAELFGILFAVVLAYYHRYELALVIIIAIAIEIVYVTITKNLLVIPRPFVPLTGVHAAYYPSDFSFPSGHATGSFAVLSAWCFREKRYYVPMLGFAALISISRVAVGVHYPLDVIGGAAIGLIIGISVARLDLSRVMRWLWNKFGQMDSPQK